MISQSSPSPKIRKLARALLTYEATAASPSENTLAVFRVVEKLGRHLGTLTGVAGFRSLLARSLTLTKAQVPGLDAAQVKPDGSLEGFGDFANQDQAAEAGIMLIAQLLGLLVVFIGEGLMLSLVVDVWPDSALEKSST